MHYGIKRRSGRYPYGSGENPFQHEGWYNRVRELEKEGKTEVEIAEELGISVSKLRSEKAIERQKIRRDNIAKAKSLREDGLNTSEIARKMGVNESTVRYWFDERAEERNNAAQTTADYLKKMVDEKGMIDVGAGAERYLGNISKTKLQQALDILEREGYITYSGRIPQATNPGKYTTQKVLTPPGSKHGDIYNFENVHSIAESDYILTDDGENIRKAFEYPASMDSKRIMIRYGDEGGEEKDGVVELRRGVKDLSLGDSHYAQIRVLVDGTHYVKGMALYSDEEFPKGVDMIFNTNKPSGTPKEKVLKPITSDPKNPFGAYIKEVGGQSYYDDPNGNYIDKITGKKQSLSLINKRAEEGDWGDWADKLPSQFLAKQNASLIKRQLDLSKTDKKSELNDILELTNPTIKRKMLYSFAEDCDASAVYLKAAALPDQKWQVILPVTSMKDTEVYAPNYKNGEKVALVRYPHGGLFEIPILTVNNKQKDAEKMIGPNAKDAVGINSNVAKQLSGADFDGDTVMVIPITDKYKISNQPVWTELRDFDPKIEYGGKAPGTFKPMKNTQNEMGTISNLITDMTLKGANKEELTRAVKHSMVVIDAEKHGLDYKQSEIDNGIKALKQKYQEKENGKYGGASTIISKAKSQVSIPRRIGQPKINPDGSLSYKTLPDDELYFTDKKGRVHKRMQKSYAMLETDDAYSLISKTNNPKEKLYADYANYMKSLANDARKEAISTPKLLYSKTANETYKKEVDSLYAKLNLAEKNKPLERAAQRLADIESEKRIKAIAKEEGAKGGYDPSGKYKIKKKEEKKIRQQSLTEARLKTGARRNPIIITPREWEAIQAGAIHDTTLYKIMNYVNDDTLKELATPKNKKGLSTSQINKIHSMMARGYTNAEIAQALHVSVSTVNNYS